MQEAEQRAMTEASAWQREATLQVRVTAAAEDAHAEARRAAALEAALAAEVEGRQRDARAASAEAEAWRERLRVLMQVPPAYASALTDAARTTSLREARRVPDAVATLQRALSARLAISDEAPIQPDLPLRPPAPERAWPPVFVAADGTAVPDSHALLGLAPEVTAPDAVREAFRVAILATPPERDPAGAERLREARDRLILPDRLLDRELGVLHVPSPEAWGLPSPLPEPPGVLRPEARLLGQLALYTLVEEALWTDGLGALFRDAIEALRANPPAAGT